MRSAPLVDATSDDKAAVETKIEALRTALKGDDDAAVKTASDELTANLQEVAAKAYQASEPTGADTNGTGAEPDADAAAEGDTADDGEEAVEGEFKEV